MKKNKRFLNILISIISIFAAIIFYVVDSTSKSTNYQEIKFEEVKELGKNGREFVYIYSNDCSACRVFQPILDRATRKTNQSIFKIDSQKENNEKKLKESNIYALPTILVVDNGKIVDRYEGAQELSKTIKILSKEK